MCPSSAVTIEYFRNFNLDDFFLKLHERMLRL